MAMIDATASARTRYAAAARLRASSFAARNALVVQLLESAADMARAGSALPLAPLETSRTATALFADSTMAIKDLSAALSHGWHGPEDWGVWTSERDAWLLLRLGPGLRPPFALDADFEAYVPHGQEQHVGIFGRSGCLAQTSYRGDQRSRSVTMLITEADLDDENKLALRLVTGAIRSPADFGEQDGRRLGIALTRITVRTLPPVGEPTSYGDHIEKPPMLTRLGLLDPRHGLRHALWGRGWSDVENEGVWSIGTDAHVSFRLPDDIAFPVKLDMVLYTTLVGDVQQQLVIRCGDLNPVREQFADGDGSRRDVRVVVDRASVGSDNVVSLHLLAARYTSLAAHGLSVDARTLGIGLTAIRIAR